MAESDYRLPIKEVTRSITVRVHLVGFRGWLIRKWFAVQLIRFGVRLLGMGVIIDERQDV